MSNIKDRMKFEKLDNTIWKKSKVDSKGRTILPKKLRQKLGLNNHNSILWISVKRTKQDNIFNLEIGVKK